MGLRDVADALDAVQLAQHLGAQVRSAEELTNRAKLDQLEALQPGAFSACTFQIGDRYIIVYSPLATPGRTQSDLAHECAHLLLEHQLKEVQSVGPLTFYSCDSDEEQEANWLAGCLLLPRPLLLRAAKSGLDVATIAARYTVSEQMAAYRLRATGVLRQINAR
jgi:Zn-dependent peptidase ImmA (M78 family)